MKITTIIIGVKFVHLIILHYLHKADISLN